MNSRKKTLALVSFLAQATICMVNFALVYHMKYRFGMEAGEIGIASSLHTVTYFLSCIVLEKPLCRFRRRSKAMTSLIGMGMCHLMILFVPCGWMLYPLLALYGVFMSLLWPNMEAWITEGDGEEEFTASVSLFNFSWSFGAGLSTMVGGFLVEIGSGFAVGISVMLFLAAGLLLLGQKSSARDEDTGKAAVQKDDSTSLRYFSWIGIFLSYSCYALMMNIFPLHALDDLGFSESLTGTLLLCRGMAACFSFLILARARFWKFSFSSIILSQTALAFIFILFSRLSSAISYSVLFLAYGFVFALVYELSIFHGAFGAVNPERRMIVHEVLINVGQVLGSVLGGFLYQIFSFTMILKVLSILTIVFLIGETAAYPYIKMRDKRV